jgi:drug/metabolite transporter (DMT)-like permease
LRVSRNLKADLLLIFNTVVWGATFVLVKDALSDTSVFVYLALRFLVAAALLVAIYGRELRGLSASGFGAGVLVGGCMFGGYSLQTVGIGMTTPSKAAFVTGFSVVLVPVLLALFGRRRIRAWVWAGAGSAVAGLYLLTIPVAGLAELNHGDLLVLCGAFMYALHIISLGHFTKRYSAGAMSLLQVGTTAVGTSAAVPLLAATHWEPARLVWTHTAIAAVLVTGVLGTALAFSAQAWAQQYTSSAHTAIIFTLEPVIAGLTSFFFYHERLGWRALAGAALILAGILVAELLGPTPAAPESA